MTNQWKENEFDPDWPWGHFGKNRDGNTVPVVIRRVAGFDKEELVCFSEHDKSASPVYKDGSVGGFLFGLRLVNAHPPAVQTVEQDVEITFEGVKAVFRAEAHLFADGRVIPGGFYLKEPKDD